MEVSKKRVTDIVNFLQESHRAPSEPEEKSFSGFASCQHIMKQQKIFIPRLETRSRGQYPTS